MKIDLILQSKDRTIEDPITKSITINSVAKLKSMLTTEPKFMQDSVPCNSTKFTIYELVGFEITKCCDNCKYNDKSAMNVSRYCNYCFDSRGNGYCEFIVNDTIGIIEEFEEDES